MARTKFGFELKRSIRSEYGTEDEFAHAVGLSQGRVSQIVNAPARTVSYSTLETILTAFSSVRDQEFLYQEWREAHAPSPASRPFDDGWTEDAVRGYVNSAQRLVMEGSYRSVSSNLAQMWSNFKGVPEQSDLAGQIATALHSVLCTAYRRYPAIALAKETQELARSHGDRPQLITGLWLEAVAARPLSPLTQSVPGSALESAISLTSDWKPNNERCKDMRVQLVGSLLRDRAILASYLHRCGMASTELIQVSLKSLQKVIGEAASNQQYVLGKEAEARLLADLERIDESHYAIDESVSHADICDKTTRVKTSDTTIRLYILEKEFDAARTLLAETIEVAEDGNMAHSRIKLLELEKRITDE